MGIQASKIDLLMNLSLIDQKEERHMIRVSEIREDMQEMKLTIKQLIMIFQTLLNLVQNQLEAISLT